MARVITFSGHISFPLNKGLGLFSRNKFAPKESIFFPLRVVPKFTALKHIYQEKKIALTEESLAEAHQFVNNYLNIVI